MKRIEPLAGLTDEQCSVIEGAANLLFEYSAFATSRSKANQMIRASSKLRELITHSENTQPESEEAND